MGVPVVLAFNNVQISACNRLRRLINRVLPLGGNGGQVGNLEYVHTGGKRTHGRTPSRKAPVSRPRWQPQRATPTPRIHLASTRRMFRCGTTAPPGIVPPSTRGRPPRSRKQTSGTRHPSAKAAAHDTSSAHVYPYSNPSASPSHRLTTHKPKCRSGSVWGSACYRSYLVFWNAQSQSDGTEISAGQPTGSWPPAGMAGNAMANRRAPRSDRGRRRMAVIIPPSSHLMLASWSSDEPIRSGTPRIASFELCCRC
jgi:hypothetical protein